MTTNLLDRVGSAAFLAAAAARSLTASARVQTCTHPTARRGRAGRTDHDARAEPLVTRLPADLEPP